MTPSPEDAPTTSAPDTSSERLLTITEAATILRTPVATLRYWRHLGTGPHSFRLGRRVLYRHDELTTWINNQHDHDRRSQPVLRLEGRS